MSAGIWFWILFVLCVFFNVFFNWPADPNKPQAWGPFGGSLLLFVLIGLLGWGIFGAPLK